MTQSADERRPVVILGGWLSNPEDYRGMADILAHPPFNRVVYIVDFRRGAWARLRDPDFRVVLGVLSRTVDLALQETGAERLDLIGHSAGGRIVRVYLGDKPYYGNVYNGQRHVANMTTLGTAHSTVEIYVAKFGAFVNEAYPGAYYPHITYRSVVGESVRGRRIGWPEEMIAYQSYELVCGDGKEIGDGIAPVHSCYLPGADNLVLPGVRHAPYNAPRSWYGAPGIVETWFRPLHDQHRSDAPGQSRQEERSLVN